MSLLVEIITPEARLFSGNATYVQVPGSEGEFGVLSLHMKMISSLKCGLVKITTEDEKESFSFAVSEGFAEVGQHKCAILVERALDLSKINSDELKSKLSSLEKLSSDHPDDESISAEIQLIKIALG